MIKIRSPDCYFSHDYFIYKTSFFQHNEPGKLMVMVFSIRFVLKKITMPYKNKLKKLLYKLDLTQDYFCLNTGIKPPQFNRYVQGTGNPTQHTINRILSELKKHDKKIKYEDVFDTNVNFLI